MRPVEAVLPVSEDIHELLVTALDEMADALHVLRIDETAITTLYRNRAAACGPGISLPDIHAAIAEDCRILRAGRTRDSICELSVRRFNSFEGRFAVAIERDVTDRDRLERAYDEAATRAQIRANRYASLCRLAAKPWSSLDERVTAILAFAVRELRMDSGLLMLAGAESVRTWHVAGEHGRRIEIPESFVLEARTPGATRILSPWPGTAAPIRFSSCCIARGNDEHVLLALAGAHIESELDEREQQRFGGEFLSLCATLAIGGYGPGVT